MIVVTVSTFAEYDDTPLRLLRESGRAFEIHRSGKRITTAELRALGDRLTVAIAGVEPYDRETLAALPHLQCISRVGVGVDAIDLTAATERGIAVLNTPEPPTNAVAELALSMMLSLSRNLPRQALAARAGQWARLESHLIGARRVGIVGLGRIGRRVATLCRAFGCEVWGTDPAADAGWCDANGVRAVPLDILLTGCDVISIHAAKSSGAPLKFGVDELARMRPGAILINLGRGDMVDLEALHQALTSGRLFGAGLDVYPEEPYRGPLSQLDNVVLTPHSATLAVETRTAMERECVQKTLDFLDGTLPPSERVR
jgi:D-3-phosphoglycerate dehydrogenase